MALAEPEETDALDPNKGKAALTSIARHGSTLLVS
jgi:hypothetical protein